jgi:8-oxo-dGTP pyrophosphatase MutT (NUDIX family)
MEEKILHHATICFLKRGNFVLLGFKTRKIGKDCWNGYGGGIEIGERPKAAAVRELEEEVGVHAAEEELEKIAIVDFHNTTTDGNTFVCRCHIYFVHRYTGEIKETEEMITPTWFDIDQMPYNKMMPADPDFLPHSLRGRKLRAKAYLGPFQKEKLKETEIEFIDSFGDEDD